MDFFQFTDPASDRPALVCIGPNTAVCSIFDERSFVRTFGRYCVYRDTASGQIYLGVWGTRLASKFRRLMREGGIDLQVQTRMPATFVSGGLPGNGSENWKP